VTPESLAGLATDVVRLDPARSRGAGIVLARAFHDDPGFVWLFPDERKRVRRASWLCWQLVRYGLRHGRVYSTSADPLGAAIWLPGDARFTLGFWRMLRAGLYQAPFWLGPKAVARLLRLTDLFESHHRRSMAADHFYLFFLGVEPALQGKGLGGALIAPVLAEADAQERPCYLETMKERNLHFYRRAGFEVVAEADAAPGGPRFWTMRREPQRAP
jgi:ribosomal protein S18 acetylase RimI-like enzyme